MTDPFKIDGPAVINFSGGRTSGVMLKRILDAHSGSIPDDVFVVFDNTSKERPETLDFVRECETRWGVHVWWLERTPLADKTQQAIDLLAAEIRELLDPANVTAAIAHLRAVGAISLRDTARLLRGYCFDKNDVANLLANCFRVVCYETATRDGSVFETLIEERGYLPNPITRYCTTEMKTLTTERFMRAQGYDHWTEVMGLRADEPHRVARMRAGAGRKYRDVECPLAVAGVDVTEVNRWWRAQPFDLALRPWEGNCDLCHLKGISKIKRILRDAPELAAWWIRMESVHRPEARLQAFRNDRPAYDALLTLVQEAKRVQPAFQFADDDPETDLDDLGDCVCSGAA